MSSKKNVEFFQHNILPPLAGVSLALPFIFYSAGWLSIVAVLPFLYYLHLQFSKLTRKNFVLSVWAVGVIFNFVVVGWILNTRPDNWAYIPGWQGAIALTIIYLLIVLFLSVQFVIFGLIYARLRPNLLAPQIFIILPSVWVVAEVLRSLAFSLLAYGPGGSIGTHWNFGVLGLAGSVTPLGFSARLVGLYGVSFLVVVINLALFWLLHKRYKLPLIVLAVVLLLSLLGYKIYDSTGGNKLTGGLLQLDSRSDPTSANDSYVDRFKSELESKDIAPNSIGLLVLPEYSDFYRDENKPMAIDITKRYLEPQGGVVTSVDGHDTEKTTNDLRVYGIDGSVRSRFAKQFLIPVGEYMPNVVAVLLRLFGQKEALEIANSSQVIAQGKVQIMPVEIAGVKVGSLACSGIIAPEFYRGLSANGATILTNSAALAMFTHAPLYHAQSRQMARFHAIANAKPFIQASEGAYSYAIDSNGRFVFRTNQIGQHFELVSIQINSQRTLYTLLGEWLAIVCTIVVAILIVKTYHKR